MVVGNTKAGNNDGANFMNAFRSLLNPLQVVDVGKIKMEEGLRWIQLLNDLGLSGRALVLIAGGDGTIG